MIEGNKGGAAGGAGGDQYCKAGKWDKHGSFPLCLVVGSPPTICEVTSQCVVDEGGHDGMSPGTEEETPSQLGPQHERDGVSTTKGEVSMRY